MWALIYETKGLSLEQVDELYAKVDKAWHSSEFVPTVSFQEVQQVGPDRMHSLAEAEATVEHKKGVHHKEKHTVEKV